MNKLMLKLLTVFLVQNAFAQNSINETYLTTYADGVNGKINGYKDYRTNIASAESGYQILYSADGGVYITVGAASWADAPHSETNRTISGGATSLMRGTEPLTVYLTINHKFNGRIYAYDYSSYNKLTDRQTTIEGKDDPNISRITGSAIGGYYGGNDNAITTYSRRGRFGNWTFIEGNYFGSPTFSGGYLRCLENIDIQGASFLGSDNQSGLFVLNSTSLTISNRTGIATDRIQGGLNSTDTKPSIDVGTKVEYTTASGLTAFILGEVHIYGGDFISAKKGDNFSINIEAQDNVILSKGGSGAYFKQVTDLTIEDGNYYGGGGTDITIYGKNMKGESSGGPGLFVTNSVIVTIEGGNYEAGSGGSVSINPGRYIELTGAESYQEGTSDANGRALAMGSAGLRLETVETSTLTNLTCYGSNGSTAKGSAIADASGGSGLLVKESGSFTASGGEYYGGNGGRARGDGVVNANGGHGVLPYNVGTPVINGGTFTGGDGGTASGDGSLNAYGGAGLYASSDLASPSLIINGGTFTGGDGGTVSGDGNVNAYGGAGVLSSGTDLTINGGTFSGGAGGNANNQQEHGDIAIWTQDANLTINNSNTWINGNVFFVNTSTNSKTFSVNDWTINGDIITSFSGSTTNQFNTPDFAGTIYHQSGILEIPCEDSLEVSNIVIEDNATILLRSDAGINDILNSDIKFLGTNSYLRANNRVSLKGSIDIGNGKMILPALVDKGMKLSLNIDFLNPINSGTIEIGNSFTPAIGCSIKANGIANTPIGTTKIADAIIGVSYQARISKTKTVCDFGWLTTQMDAYYNGNNETIVVTHDYNSITNRATLVDSVTLSTLSYVDNLLTTVGNSNLFYNVNSMGEEKGTEDLLYSLSKMPDVANASFNAQQKMVNQISSRGSEFRSMNGYASTKSPFGEQSGPTGAGGPDSNRGSLQGWTRAYGSFADHGAQDGASQYDEKTYGTVVGIDKSFGDLLVGIAGSYAHTSLDSDSSEETTDQNTYSGSIYATAAGETAFLDLFLTYGKNDGEEKNNITKGDFKADLFNVYIGAGKAFGITENISLTPEVSFLASYYDQDAYTRKGEVVGDNMDIEAYDEWSYLGSLGATLSTKHQIDWMDQDLAFIPEIRAHWLHEFNPDIDDGRYTLSGSSGTLNVSAREEDVLRIGFGFDIWNWKYENTKFEIDYDGYFTSEYTQNVLSGKITYLF